jgi:hypothetical protein
MKWFRVEFNPKGEIVHLLEMDRGAPDGMMIVYVQATSEDAARAKAQAMRAKIAMRARRAENRSKGLCKDCGRKRKPGFVKCSVCIERARERETRLAPASKAPRYRARRATVKESERLATLLEVQEHASKDIPAFRKWLAAEISKLLVRGDKAA